MTSALLIARCSWGSRSPVIGAGLALDQDASAPDTVLGSPSSSRSASQARAGHRSDADPVPPRTGIGESRRFCAGRSAEPHASCRGLGCGLSSGVASTRRCRAAESERSEIATAAASDVPNVSSGG